jgi:RNA polymerase sigma factor (sigma-70 family)
MAIAARASMQPDVARRDALQRALDRLPYRQRAALVLRFYEDLSERQTAHALGCAVGTVKSLVSRGLRTLREEMRDEESD